MIIHSVTATPIHSQAMAKPMKRKLPSLVIQFDEDNHDAEKKICREIDKD